MSEETRSIMDTHQNPTVQKPPASEPPKYYNVSSVPQMAHTYEQYNSFGYGQFGTNPNYTNGVMGYSYPTSYPIGQPAMAYQQQYQYQPPVFNIVGPSTNQNLTDKTSLNTSTKNAQTFGSVEKQPHVEKKTGNVDADPEMTKLLENVRSILDKITPETFDKAANEFLKLEPLMNTAERCTGVVEVVFQKAVEVPETCALYIDLCDRMIKVQLQQHQQAAGQQKQYALGGSLPFSTNVTNFRRVLLNKCQNVFEKYVKSDEATVMEGMPKLKTDVKDFKERRQFLGNVRFIGELYNRATLTEKIIHHCASSLQRKANKNPEALESLCTLLTVIGKRLELMCDWNEESKADLDDYYDQLEALAQNQQLADRYRLMILDLLALRNNGWEQVIKGDGRRDGQWTYSREFMCAAAKLPLANVRPKVDTTKWSADNLNNVFPKGKKTKNQKRKQRNIPTYSDQDQGRKTGGGNGPPDGCGSEIVSPQAVVDVESHPGKQAWHLEPKTEAQLDKPWTDVCTRLSKLEQGIATLNAKIDDAVPSCAMFNSTAAVSTIGDQKDQKTTAVFSSKQPTKVHMVISSGVRECTMQTDPIDGREQIIRLLHKNPELIDFVKTYIRAVEN